MGNIYLKILFSALPQYCILLHVAATAAHPLQHPPACLATFHFLPCWRCYFKNLPYFADFWDYFWTCNNECSVWCSNFCKNWESSRYASGQSAWCVMHGGGGILFSGNTADTLVRVGRQLEQAAAICQHIGVQCSYRRRPAETCPLFIPAHYAWACQLTLSRN